MTEDQYMPAIREVRQRRVNEIGLKGKAKDREAAAYMQGVLAALTTTNVMTMDRASMIGFLFAIGRGTEFLEGKRK